MSTPYTQPLINDITVRVKARELNVHVLSPSRNIDPDPLLLLSFAGDRDTSLCSEPFDGAANFFLDHGHRAASFSLPQHGEHVDGFGEGIAGLRNALVAGHNRFEEFLHEASTVIDECIVRGWATPGRIVVSGTSRAGYLALRLLASDPRVAAAAAFAPVTDWRRLDEFSNDVGRADVAAQHLSNFTDGMAGKPAFIVIGNHDDRVSTDECCRFYLELRKANMNCGYGDSHLNFQVQDVPGHASTAQWQEAGAVFLMTRFEVPDREA